LSSPSTPSTAASAVVVAEVAVEHEAVVAVVHAASSQPAMVAADPAPAADRP
jgi:hypothetical protein